MPTLILRTRRPELVERMDDPACDRDRLDRTYHHFTTLNRLIAGWGRVYTRWIRPRLQLGPATLVDLGTGGADVPWLMARRAARDGFSLTVTGVDPDPRAIEYARRREGVGAIACDSAALVAAGRTFDFVVSNHVMHHLDDAQRAGFLADSERLATVAAVHNDIRRDDLGYAGFSVFGGFFPGSFIREDGLTSIRRSYTRAELAAVLPNGWRAVGIAPFRLLSVHEKR